MTKSKHIPKRRFPGFEGKWEEVFLGKLGNAQSGIGFPDSEQGGKVGIPFYKVSDMNNQGNEHEMVFANNYVTIEQIKQRSWKPIQDVPAILFAKVGAAVLLNRKRLCSIPFLMDNNTMAFSIDTSKFDTNFAKTIFETIDLTSLVQVAALPSYNARDVESILVSVPSILEQEKIGEFFQKIDSLITIHQHKLDKLKNLKKAYLAEMLPTKGESVPKRRFPGFEGEWEKHRLISLCDVFSDGDWIEAKDQSNSGIRLLQTGNVGITEYLAKSGNMKWISEETFENLHCKEVMPGDILISRLPDPAGRACIVPNTGQKMITSVDCTIVRTRSEISNSFLVQYLSSTLYFNEVSTCLAGGTRQRISRSNLADIMINIPTSKMEQDKIGHFFQNLDNSIALQQQKLDKLNNLKKAYLNELFV